MNFTYLTTEEEFKQAEKEMNNGTRDDFHFIRIIPKGDIDRVMIVARNDDKMIGEVAVSIYSTDTLERKSVWIFGENENRSAWIDRIDSSVKGLGRILLEKAKEWVMSRIHLCQRKNLYVASLHDAVNFYRKCGYARIHTPQSQVDEDYTFVYESEVANIMALPLMTELDEEVTDYSRYIDDYDKLMLVLEGEPDTENLLSKAEKIIENRYDKEGCDENDLMMLSRCLETGNESVTKNIIKILSTFPWVDQKAIKYAKEGKQRYEKYRSDLSKGLETPGIDEKYL